MTGQCVVTGCFGFIGSHLSERVLVYDYAGVGIDLFKDYYPPAIKNGNSAWKLGHAFSKRPRDA